MGSQKARFIKGWALKRGLKEEGVSPFDNWPNVNSPKIISFIWDLKMVSACPRSFHLNSLFSESFGGRDERQDEMNLNGG